MSQLMRIVLSIRFLLMITKIAKIDENLDISCFRNIVDPDQLASEKPADQGPHCFPTLLVKTYF